MDERPWARVAEKVKTRREDAGLTQRQLAERAGTTDRYISAIERAERDTYQQKMLRAIARALGWQPGSIDLILEGGEPVDADPPDTRSIEERVTALEAELADIRTLVASDPDYSTRVRARQGREPAGGTRRAG